MLVGITIPIAHLSKNFFCNTRISCMHASHLRKHIASQLIRQFDMAFVLDEEEMVNKHDIARLRKLNTFFRIAINDILCDTDSAHGIVKRVYLL